MAKPSGFLASAVVGLLLAVPSPASGQAWTPAKGSGSVTLSFQYLEGADHLFSVDVTGKSFGGGYVGRGRRADLGEVAGRSLALRVDYGVTDRLALGARLPYVWARYVGRIPHPGVEADDGSFHSGLQDLSVELRYKALDRRVVVTPFVAYGTPASDYGTLGHASLGRGLDEARLGVYFGAPSSLFTWVHASYSYAFVEEVLGVSTDRSDATLAVGYQRSQRLGMRLFGSHLDTRGGIDWLTDFDTGSHAGQFVHHDQLSRTEATLVGLGLTYSRGLYDVDLSVSRAVDGENTHELTGSTLSLSWSF
ncbi:MAG TPA: hypothetical protein VMS86_08495 [Thermoanaerobaculia bacterium]|nr:hypothetical protein [Thermoanaerobaculia bacterium]